MNIVISNSADDPIYQQIVKQIKNLIIKGMLEEGEALPSIRNLAKELHISVITTKRAYEELEREGFINKITGKGSFVAPQNQDLLKERRLKIVEEKMLEAVEAARMIELPLSELLEMLEILYEEA
ncbi:MAG TPA: GntR family transcriptional regulator [Halanaerobiales bacterium]|nr:GntR family transcriptional regulator [Halanaerobiales bacterium]